MSAPRLAPAQKTLVWLQISSGRVADGVDGESRRAFRAGRQGGLAHAAKSPPAGKNLSALLLIRKKNVSLHLLN